MTCICSNYCVFLIKVGICHRFPLRKPHRYVKTVPSWYHPMFKLLLLKLPVHYYQNLIRFSLLLIVFKKKKNYRCKWLERKKTNPSSYWNQRLPDIAKRLEETIFKESLNKVNQSLYLFSLYKLQICVVSSCEQEEN